MSKPADHKYNTDEYVIDPKPRERIKELENALTQIAGGVLLEKSEMMKIALMAKQGWKETNQ